MLGVIFVVAVIIRLQAAREDVATTPSAAVPESVTAPADRPPLAPGASTGTIAEVWSATASATAPTATGANTREQRYQDLLRSGSPAPAQPPAAVAPTPAQPVPERKPPAARPAPATSTAAERRPAPAPVATPAPAPARQTPQQPQRPAYPGDRREDNPPEEADPESDTRPPQLLGMQFNPPLVQDGETTTLAINAQDDLSGIRTISGVIANPAGATVSGFAAQLEAETNRYVARIVVPKDAAEGNWHIKYLTLADKASNSVNLAYGQGLAPNLASFRVTSSRSDGKGPELKALWIDKRSMGVGDRNSVFVQVEDDKAGVQVVSGIFVSPSKVARIGFGCKLGSTGAWECPLNVPECVDCGVWQLEQIQMQDKANNTTTARSDNQMVSAIQVSVTGDRCDGVAPVLTALALNPIVVSNAQPSRIDVTATVQDDNCGGSTLSGLATGPQGQRLNIQFDPSKDGQHFTGRIEVGPNQAKGTYAVAWIQALDKGQNLKAYSSSDPVVGRVTFRVE